MKKKQKIFLSLLSLLIINLLTFWGCSGSDNYADENSISYEQLPSLAQDFLKTYYKDVSISTIEMDEEDNMIIYEVKMNNGDEIIFNEKGEWEQVDAPDGETIPTGFIMEEILEYLNLNYQGYGINEINKTGYGYKVELVTELDLMFNELGQFIGPVSED